MKLRNLVSILILICTSITILNAQNEEFKPLFSDDLANADFAAGVWSIKDGVITATEDQCIWTQRDYDDFFLELEFKTAKGTNSGVIVYCSDTEN